MVLSNSDHVQYFLFSIYYSGSAISTSFFFSSFFMIERSITIRPVLFSLCGDDSNFCFRAFYYIYSFILSCFLYFLSLKHIFYRLWIIMGFYFFVLCRNSNCFSILCSISFNKSKIVKFFCSAEINPISLDILIISTSILE